MIEFLCMRLMRTFRIDNVERAVFVLMLLTTASVAVVSSHHYQWRWFSDRNKVLIVPY